MITLPVRIKGLLTDSVLDGPVAIFNDRVSQLLGDNKLPFFPAYTDHGLPKA
jgi:hypothetical protein